MTIPEAPLPANSYFYDGSQLRSSSVFDPSTNSYVNTVYASPQEVQARQALQQQYNELLGQLGKTTPEQQQRLSEFEQTFFQQSRRPLEEEYQRGMSQARESFNATGFMNSTGYEDYRARNLDKLFQDGLRQAAQDARLAREKLAADYESQLIRRLQSLSGNLSGNTAASTQLSDTSAQLANSLNQFATQNYQNQLAAARLRRESQARSATGIPPLFGRLFNSFLSSF